MIRAVASYLLAALAFVAVAQVFLPLKARGQDHSPHHKYYQHWKEPGTQNSCCNARIDHGNGHETGDCEPARAEIRGGDWWVYVRQIPGWIPVPDAKIIRERNPSGQESHLCWTPARGIICFVPEDTGG